jgi:uncharacterized protein YbaR (Trm112 family)
MIDPRLLDVLACPKCHGTLVADESGPALVCRACALSFPVREGIPVMLVDEAVPLGDAARLEGDEPRPGPDAGKKE